MDPQSDQCDQDKNAFCFSDTKLERNYTHDIENKTSHCLLREWQNKVSPAISDKAICYSVGK